MSPSDGDTLGRFRATLLGRVQRVLELLPTGAGSSADPAVRKDLLGELHTLKGEARMLGLSLLSSLAHALEDAIGRDERPLEEIAPVVDGILLALSEGTPDDLVRELLETGLHALGREDAISQGRESTPNDRAAEEAAPEESTPETSDADGSAAGGATASTTGEADASATDESKAGAARRSAPVSSAATSAAARGPRWIQVDARIVDELCESLANLATDFGRFTTTATEESSDGTERARAAAADEAERLRARLSDCLLLSLGLRLTPLEPELRRLAAHVRRTAATKGISTEVVVRAWGVQVEREVLDMLADPLVHLANNAIEHGVLRRTEPSGAKVEFVAENVGTSVAVRVHDNGPGIDPEAVHRRAVQRGLVEETAEIPELERVLPLLFRPGFSTRDSVDEGAGRGVGLDVVQRQVQSVGGTVRVESEQGQGTTFVVSIPAALTQVRVLVLEVCGTLIGLPIDWVDDVVGLEGAERSLTYVHRGTTIPRRELADVLSLGEDDVGRLVVLALGQRRFALSCGAVLGQYELIRRPTSPALASRFGVGASGQLDDGRLVLLLDQGFLQRLLHGGASDVVPTATSRSVRKKRILVVDDSVIVRDLIQEILVAAGYRIETASDGQEALDKMDVFAPDLVLTDVEMPRLDGFGLLEELRKLSSTLPVVVLSAKSKREDRLRASSLGANAYVTKGEFETEAMVRVVERYLPGDD